ncbi:hypothetical protein ACH5AJ_36520 [Streptomyces rochei]|uniref:hypothetical protein n=1 Tax=Streptomyces rochei TaxID=1928 RepID=UPI0037ABAD03
MAYLNQEKGSQRAGKRASAVADAAALGSVVAAGANPTKAEYDALRTDVANLRTKLNAALAALRTAGVIAP